MKLGSLELDGRPLVAVSFTDADSAADVEAARNAGVAICELRIDLFVARDPAFVRETVRRLAGVLPTLATIRLIAEGGAWSGDEDQRAALFETVLPVVDGVDVELQAAATLARVGEKARAAEKRIIASFHDFAGVPTSERLDAMALEARDAGADIFKAACMLKSDADLEILKAFTRKETAVGKVVLGMGEALGPKSRIVLPGEGSLFTFAAGLSRASAPGQMPYDRTLALLAEAYPA